MKPITTINRTLAPLRRSNVDTDQIMPKEYLKRVERTGYGEFLFADWRGQSDFVFNDPRYRDAGILVTGANFGCGSSREHAPWGLQDWGFEALVAPSFADIFRTNCTKIGLLPVELSEKEVEWLLELAEADPAAAVEIDLDAQTVTYGSEFEARFEIDGFVKGRLLNGLDDIGLTLRREGDIADHEAHRPSFKPAVARSAVGDRA